MFQLPVASEVVNVVNFVVLDLIMVWYIWHITGLLAGHANYFTLEKNQRLDIIPCGLPLIGGGVCMPNGRPRYLLLALRLSVVVAVFTCNFGLQGRSLVRVITRNAKVRVPGPPSSSHQDLYVTTELRQRCLRPIDRNRDVFSFGAVVDDICYPELDDYVYISELAYKEESVDASATNCAMETDCEFLLTKFRCDNVEISCPGLLAASGCELPPNLQSQDVSINPNGCFSVVYAQNETYAWVCERGSLYPGVQGKHLCRGLSATREALKWWLDYYMYSTNDILESLFASAYGAEKEVIVDVPTEEDPVTLITWWWLAPFLWVLSVSVAVSLLELVILTKRKPTPVVAHDERGLTRIFGRMIAIHEAWRKELPQKGLLDLSENEFMVRVVLDEDTRDRARVLGNGAACASPVNPDPLILEGARHGDQEDEGLELT